MERWCWLLEKLNVFFLGISFFIHSSWWLQSSCKTCKRKIGGVLAQTSNSLCSAKLAQRWAALFAERLAWITLKEEKEDDSSCMSRSIGVNCDLWVSLLFHRPASSSESVSIITDPWVTVWIMCSCSCSFSFIFLLGMATPACVHVHAVALHSCQERKEKKRISMKSTA